MTPHEEKIVIQWRKDHPVADFCLQVLMCFVFFVVIPMFFAIFYKLFGFASTSIVAWLEGFGTTLAIMIIASFWMKSNHGKK